MTSMLHLVQFWSLPQLKTLKLDKTMLRELPASVGRLQELEVLSLSWNNLNGLPITLGFCKQLKHLDLQGNKFTAIPGIVLKLKALDELRRHNNPLRQMWNGLEAPPHIRSHEVTPSSKRLRTPDDLQSLAASTVMTEQVNYWQNPRFPPLQCKIIDSLASKYQYCGHCHQNILGVGE